MTTHGAKGPVDVEVGFTAPRMFRIFVGARNLFDTCPDRMSYNNGSNISPFPPAAPFGYKGRFVSTRVNVDFGR